mmetsp:Transcript_22654/g.70161  ORF Transcript_22654/g.70161 Transcript_22654/m.70161 type:complete len:224 (-) Transcript_22654:464-1135(-)
MQGREGRGEKGGAGTASTGKAKAENREPRQTTCKPLANPLHLRPTPAIYRGESRASIRLGLGLRLAPCPLAPCPAGVHHPLRDARFPCLHGPTVMRAEHGALCHDPLFLPLPPVQIVTGGLARAVPNFAERGARLRLPIALICIRKLDPLAKEWRDAERPGSVGRPGLFSYLGLGLLLLLRRDAGEVGVLRRLPGGTPPVDELSSGFVGSLGLGDMLVLARLL